MFARCLLDFHRGKAKPSIPPNLESIWAQVPPFSSSSPPSPFGLIVKGVDCPVKNRGSFNLPSIFHRAQHASSRYKDRSHCFCGKSNGPILAIGPSAFYVSQTDDQKRFTISKVAADWHELMIPQRTMRPSIARVSEQLDPRFAAGKTYYLPNQPH